MTDNENLFCSVFASAKPRQFNRREINETKYCSSCLLKYCKCGEGKLFILPYVRTELYEPEKKTSLLFFLKRIRVPSVGRIKTKCENYNRHNTLLCTDLDSISDFG